MNMKPPIWNAATLVVICAGLLPAADLQLLSLVMPDAKILAGVNVDAVKTTPFGVYVLGQVQAQGAQHLQQVGALTGFDPTRDLHELLIASTGAPGAHSGLILARGNFDVNRIQAAGKAGGGSTLDYKGVTLLLDPKQMNAVAFLDSTLAVAGDIANVESAIDRQNASTSVSGPLMTLVNQWSASQDAWAITNAPLPVLGPRVNGPNPPNPAVQNAFQSIQQAAGGVKFGTQIVFTGHAQTDTAQNATAIANVVQFLASMAQMQAQQKNPQLAAILPTLSVTASANLVDLSLSVAESQAEQAFHAHSNVPAPGPIHRAPRRR